MSPRPMSRYRGAELEAADMTAAIEVRMRRHDTALVRAALREELARRAAEALATLPSDDTDADRMRELATLASYVVRDPYHPERVDWGAILEAFREE